jgi:hypothetical protein
VSCPKSNRTYFPVDLDFLKLLIGWVSNPNELQVYCKIVYLDHRYS